MDSFPAAATSARPPSCIGPGGGGASRPWLPPSPFLALTTPSLENGPSLVLFLAASIRGYITPTCFPYNGSVLHCVPPMGPSLVVCRGLPDRSFRNNIAQVSNSMTFPGRHLQVRCVTKLVSSPAPASALLYSPNGNAVVYLFLRNTKLVFTWCTARHGMMCSRSSFSYARMLWHAIFK